ncbi:hypothetical protein BGZ65_003175 [Modicella reniformis]|uniref:Uncharacterized protein n=1 Tax=Modicella reniformis TaxID=1440133 RepID=A0A9P6ILF6_9FUNG|nr:hypothetical protein BGZ65_003175 [Modicella reniformis]
MAKFNALVLLVLAMIISVVVAKSCYCIDCGSSRCIRIDSATEAVFSMAWVPGRKPGTGKNSSLPLAPVRNGFISLTERELLTMLWKQPVIRGRHTLKGYTATMVKRVHKYAEAEDRHVPVALDLGRDIYCGRLCGEDESYRHEGVLYQLQIKYKHWLNIEKSMSTKDEDDNTIARIEARLPSLNMVIV